MPVCPSGHQSQTSDYCDTCGAVMGGAPITHASAIGGLPESALAATVLSSSVPPAGGSAESCPQCGADRDGRFCEECGYDFELAALVPPPVAEPAAPDPAPVPSANGVAAASQSAASVPEAPLVPPPVMMPELGPEMQPPPAVPGEAPYAAAEAAAPGVGPTETYLPDFGALEEAAPGPGSVLEAEPAEAEPAPAFGADPAAGDPSAVPGPPLTVLATADLEYYTAQVQRGDIIESDYPFPKYPQELRFTLDGDKARIGRSSASRGIAVEVDLASPPVDPAVSHLHAQFLRVADGSWAVVDLNSANGTRINGAADPIPTETEVPVAAGDRIHLGVWTTLTLAED